MCREADGDNKVALLCLDARYSSAVAHWLRLDGVCVEIAGSGKQARALLEGDGERVLVTDRVLPPWPGLPRFVVLKRSSERLRIVAIERGDPDSRYLASAAGADTVISIPLRRDEVMRAIRVAQGSRWR
jgi:DNA-binding response OmpR family regulator